MGIDEPAVAQVVVAPHPLEQLVTAQHRPGVIGELAQQAVLGAGQAHLDPVTQHHLLISTQLDRTEAHDVLAVAPARPVSPARELHPTEQGTDPGRQFAGHDRLGHVIVSARLESGDHVGGVGLGRHHDDRNRAHRPQGPTHLETRQTRKTEVEEDDVGVVLTELNQAGRPVTGLEHGEPLVLEREAQGETDRVVVLDEEQRMHRRKSASGRLRRVFRYRNRTFPAQVFHSRPRH